MKGGRRVQRSKRSDHHGEGGTVGEAVEGVIFTSLVIFGIL